MSGVEKRRFNMQPVVRCRRHMPIFNGQQLDQHLGIPANTDLCSAFALHKQNDGGLT